MLATTTKDQEAEHGRALVSTDCGGIVTRLGQLTFRIYVKEKKNLFCLSHCWFFVTHSQT